MTNRIRSVIGIAILVGAAARPSAQSAPATNRSTTPTNVRPAARGNLSAVIHGNAVTSSNAAMSNTVVRLRDARFGRVVDTQVTDTNGAFTFNTLDPGSYVVELVGNDQHVIAASDIINVNAGDAVSAILKLPFRNPPLAGVLGQSSSSAALVTAAAAGSGVLATAVVGSAVSPTQPF